MYQFGAQSTPLMAWYPMIIMVVCLWYDALLGLIALAYGIAQYVPLFILSATDTIPYAPALDVRSIDTQQDPLYVAAQLIARYVPAELAEGILAGTENISEGHHRTKLTVFFSDIVEELEPEDMAMVLNEYFTVMTDIAREHKGLVDELQGDALLIFFGAQDSTSDKERALNAVAMANEMQAAMEGLNERWRNEGITETMTVRMGINTGVVTVGNFGSVTRTKYAVLGKHVNIAARLQALCDPGRTLLSYSTYLLVKDQVNCTSRGPGS